MKKHLLLPLLFTAALWQCRLPSPTAVPEGWQPLFDGQSLAGWKKLNGTAVYEIRDGAIVGISRLSTPNTFLATEVSYGDFILELEFLAEGLLNSGIQVRSHSRPDYQEGRVHGYQVEIDPSERAWTAGIYDEARRGWLYPLTLNETARQAYRAGQWNHLRIECIGPEIRTWLNGQPAAYLIDSTDSEGFIALQVHSIDDEALVGKTVQWRNLLIQTENLQPRQDSFPAFIVNAMPNYLAPAEQRAGWSLAWDGQTAQGWRGAHREAFPEKGWDISNGVLSVEASTGQEAAHGGDILTEQRYGAFEFQLEFKLTEGANSGIKYFVTEQYATTGSAIGLEYQLLDDERHPDATQGRDGNRTLAALYDLVAPVKQSRFVNPPGQWNHARIVVLANQTVQHWLNQQQVLEYAKGSPGFLELVQQSKYKDWEGFGLWPEGHILLQDHGDAVSFRSIKVRRLY